MLHNLPARTWWRVNHSLNLPLCSRFSFTWKLTTVLRHKPWQLYTGGLVSVPDPKPTPVQISSGDLGRDRTLLPGWSTSDFTCALVLLPDQWLCSLVWNETTCAHVTIETIENGVLCNRTGRAVNSFIDQDEFAAMKTLSGHRALRCDKHIFHDKMTVST